MPFVSELVIKPLSDRMQLFKLLNPFTYTFTKNGLKVYLTIPTGFITDFASVPKIFHSIVGRLGRHGKAAVLHDYLYYTGIYDRSTSDSLFLFAMKELGVEWYSRHPIFLAVRAWGWIVWNKHRDRDKRVALNKPKEG